MKPNKPTAPNAGIASRLTIGHHSPGVGEPERSAAQPMKSFNTFTLAPALFAAVTLLTSGCDSGLTSKASPGSAQALKRLELKTGLSFPTNAVLVASGDGGGRDASHQFYEWALFSPTPVTLPKMVAPGVQDYLKLPLKDTAEFVQSRMEAHRIVEPQAAFSTDWKTNGLAFTATLVRGIRGDYLVITQGRP